MFKLLLRPEETDVVADEVEGAVERREELRHDRLKQK